MIFLENEHIKASLTTKGAELQKLTSKETGRNYLWDGNSDYWGKFSPILFPIVGAIKNNTYLFEGKEYTLPRHGFARDNQFEAEQISNTEVVFTLIQNEETLKVYPFDFKLKLHYKITDASLSCTYIVLNPGNKELLFSVGGHPAFAIPTNEHISYDDYFLEFNKDENLVYYKINSDLIDEETEIIHLQDHSLPLSHQLFYKDALVFKTLKSDCISIKNHKDSHGLHFTFKDFPFFGIWAAKDADFVCLEPWCGIADGINHNQNLKDKEGIIALPPKGNWERSWSIVCF
ncbi:aldose 1-epimerase family protein [Pedobacter panaciterrae]|uniref:aldose 1-epimerase family protein n=1 Tax=Pedobacter panaciterrae TaxID=363849 RepID=UPI00155D909D|nr:aldose 1-epimerase family protein [Pedobacter panaciterrae]NQX52111.1 aldose 1-epimerase family protein [Pedobacter panaciterrae]